MNEKVKIIKEQDDPICTRVSVGGRDNVGYYCVYRGNIGHAIACLEKAIEALKQEDFNEKLKAGYFDPENYNML